VSGPGRLRPGPCLLTGVSAEASRVKRDFACTFTRHFPPVLVVPRSQSRLMLEGRARTLSGPSPDLSPSGLSHPGYGRTCGLRGGLGRVLRRAGGSGSSRLARRFPRRSVHRDPPLCGGVAARIAAQHEHRPSAFQAAHTRLGARRASVLRCRRSLPLAVAAAVAVTVAVSSSASPAVQPQRPRPPLLMPYTPFAAPGRGRWTFPCFVTTVLCSCREWCRRWCCRWP
jgi:hypothetical protein